MHSPTLPGSAHQQPTGEHCSYQEGRGLVHIEGLSSGKGPSHLQANEGPSNFQ